MPADRAAEQPWLIAGRLLFAPFAPRDTGLTVRETEAIEAMGARLERDRGAGLLPNCTAFWLNPINGQATPLAANPTWLRSRVMRNVVVDLGLLQAMGRVVQLTLLNPTETTSSRVIARKKRRSSQSSIVPQNRVLKRKRIVETREYG